MVYEPLLNLVNVHFLKAEAVRLLLEAGADSEIRDHQGRTALMGASAKGHSDVVRILSEQKQGTCTCAPGLCAVSTRRNHRVCKK